MPLQDSDKALITFHDVSACFSEEEWTLLHEWEKELYNNVMKEIHKALFSLGYQILNPEMLFRIYKGGEAVIKDPYHSEKRADINDPSSICHPAVNPDILLRIKHEEELYFRDPHSPKDKRMQNSPSAAEHDDISFIIKEEEDDYSVDGQAFNRRGSSTSSMEPAEDEDSVIEMTCHDEENSKFAVCFENDSCQAEEETSEAISKSAPSQILSGIISSPRPSLTGARTPAPAVSCRAGAVCETLQQAQKNKNTAIKTKQDVNTVHQYVVETFADSREMHCLPPELLDKYLASFFRNIKKKDNQAYAPHSLRSIFQSLKRHLKEEKYPACLTTDKQFQTARHVLKSMQKKLQAEGKDAGKNASDKLTDEMIQKLYERKQLGPYSPLSLLNTMWLNNATYFGIHKNTEMHHLQWQDITLKRDEKHGMYLEYNSNRDDEMRNDDHHVRVKTGHPKAFQLAGNKEQCPVANYLFYQQRRPSIMNAPQAPFYLAVNTHPSSRFTNIWYKNQPIGINRIAVILKSMIQSTGVTTESRITNQSVTKQVIKKLSDHNVQSHQIMQVAGLKKYQLLGGCHPIRPEQQKTIPGILGTTNEPGKHEVHPSTSGSAVPASATSILNITPMTVLLNTSSKSPGGNGNAIAIHIHTPFSATSNTANQPNRSGKAPAKRKRCPSESDSEYI